MSGIAGGGTVFGGSQVIEGGGTASNTTIANGGTLVVSAGGLADPTTILGGGLEIISARGSDRGALLSGGEQDVYGNAGGATIFADSQVIEGHAPATTPLLWMRMPGGASTGLKCHIAATDKCRIGRLKQRVKAHCAGEIVRRSPTRWLGADTFDFHCSIPLCPPASAAYSFERRRQAAARPFLS